MSKVIEGLRYSESHEWVKVEGGIAVIGVTDYAQSEMGDITYVDAPDEGDEVVAGEEFGALESVKASSDLYSPVSGKVVEVNEELQDAPEKVNEDAYAAWIIKVEMSDPSELEAQARGSVLFHQKMFESRLFFVDKLIDMGAQIILCDPHRAVVVGHDRKITLRGGRMSSPDIRAGIALLIAAMGAKGTSRIDNIEQIDRGYEHIEDRLNALGAKIVRS